MSDVPAPEKPSSEPVAPAGRRPRRPGRPPPLPPAAKSGEIPWLPQALFLGGAALVMIHLVFGRTDFELRDRVLAVIPLFPLLWEINRFHKMPRGEQLPFGVYALFINYVTFSLPAIFNTVFTDLSGPVSFTDDDRFHGTAAIALSSLMIYAGILLGESAGKSLQPWLIRVSPPAAVPATFPRAIGLYALGCLVATQSVTLGTHYPVAVGVLITMTFSITYVVGAALAEPAMFRGPWSRYLLEYEFRANEGGSGEPIGIFAFTIHQD